MTQSLFHLVVQKTADQNCPYCKLGFDAEELAIACPRCSTWHHDECWAQNGTRCTIYGCGAFEPNARPRPYEPLGLTRIGPLYVRERYQPATTDEPGWRRYFGWLMRLIVVSIVFIVGFGGYLLLRKEPTIAGAPRPAPVVTVTPTAEELTRQGIDYRANGQPVRAWEVCYRACVILKHGPACVQLAELSCKGAGAIRIHVDVANSFYKFACDYGDSSACSLHCTTSVRR